MRVEPIDVRAGDVDAIKLTLEGAGVAAQRSGTNGPPVAAGVAAAFLPSRPRSASTPRMRLALESKRSSSVLSVAVCRASTRSSEVCRRASARFDADLGRVRGGARALRHGRQHAGLQARLAVGRRA